LVDVKIARLTLPGLAEGHTARICVLLITVLETNALLRYTVLLATENPVPLIKMLPPEVLTALTVVLTTLLAYKY
jgi:hypothetical protein